MFSIFAQTKKELDSYDNDRIQLASSSTAGSSLSMLHKNSNGYSFSQKEILNTIDLYANSKFETGNIDSEGHQKLFLNICNFRADVAAMQTDLDVKNFVFFPDDSASEWGAYFMTRKFKQWAKDNDLGKLINETNVDFSKYGTAVIKKVGKSAVMSLFLGIILAFVLEFFKKNKIWQRIKQK